MSKKYWVVITLTILCFCLAAFMIPVHAVTTRIRVAVNCGFPNYQYLNENGDCVGLHMDILNEIAKNQQLELEYIPLVSDSACFDALKKGEADVILGAKQVYPTEYDFLRTDIITASTLCLVASNKVADEIQKNPDAGMYVCAAENWYNVGASLAGKNASGIWSGMFRMCDSQAEVIEALINGKANVAICEKQSALYLLERYGISDNYTISINYLAGTEYSMLVRNGDNSLLRLLNSGIRNIRASGTYERIVDRWTMKDGFRVSSKTIRMIALACGGAVAAALVYALINHRMNVLLKQKVDEKTRELRRVNYSLEEKVEQLFNESEVRNSIIENSPSGMVLFDADYKISFMNKAAMAVAGITGEAPIGANVEEVGVFGEIVKRKGHTTFLEAGFHMQPEIVALDEDIKKRIFRYVVYRLLNHREPVGALLAVEDVTQEEVEKQEVFEQEKNRSLNTLIAGIAHEIKNPLTSIQTYAALIPAQINNQEFLTSFGKFVPRETERINRLIEALIGYARPVRDNMGLVNVSEMARDCLYLTQPAIRKGHTDLVADLQEDLVIHANKDQMKQVIINLLMNGLESIEQRWETMPQTIGHLPKLELCSWQEDENVFIMILDEGVGMTDEELKRCTEPFFSTKAKGSGLGMAIAKQYVQENGGILSIESEMGCFTKIIMKFRGRA